MINWGIMCYYEFFLNKFQVIICKKKHVNIFRLHFFALKQRRNLEMWLFIGYYAEILLAPPTWNQTGLNVAPELKWVWHPCSSILLNNFMLSQIFIQGFENLRAWSTMWKLKKWLGHLNLKEQKHCSWKLMINHDTKSWSQYWSK